ncbi:MAG: DUF815 domain-containing protein [Desulfuromonadaceae bacterium]|nr:DUF815 domain-containing protein [Desulfuromonadaceae bacterium]
MELADVDLDWEFLLERIERLIDLGESFLEDKLQSWEPEPDLFARFASFRWDGDQLIPQESDEYQAPSELVGLEDLARSLQQNVEQFVAGLPAQHMLLWGARGMGKTSLVRALLAESVVDGLRGVDLGLDSVDRLDELLELLERIPLNFLVVMDDVNLLSSSLKETLFRRLGGGLVDWPRNVLLCLTSAEDLMASREHLSEEYEIFGVQARIPSLGEEGYLALVERSLHQYATGFDMGEVRQQALQWAACRGRFSGRLARQFVERLTSQSALEEIRQQKPQSQPSGEEDAGES